MKPYAYAANFHLRWLQRKIKQVKGMQSKNRSALLKGNKHV